MMDTHRSEYSQSGEMMTGSKSWALKFKVRQRDRFFVECRDHGTGSSLPVLPLLNPSAYILRDGISWPFAD